MTKTQRNKKIVDEFLNTKFKGCELFIKETKYDQSTGYDRSDGFFLHVKQYYLCDTEIIYQHTNPTEFKICFSNPFLKELSRWVPLKGKKQIFRDWVFSNHLPDFEHKDQIRL